ncbi:MAG: lactate utilization protein [Bacillota bacterium]
MENYEVFEKNLTNRGFQLKVLDKTEELLPILKAIIPAGASIGIPGSVTIRQLGVAESFKTLGHKIIDTWENVDRTKRLEQLNADVILTSLNAITEDGLLVNLDGTGNRIASMCYGPRKVIAVIGKNKITKNLEEAIYRTKNIAAPQIYKRKKANTPCEKTGRCHDCQTVATKQCRVLTIHEGRTRGIEEFHIILIKEDLGY